MKNAAGIFVVVFVATIALTVLSRSAEAPITALPLTVNSLQREKTEPITLIFVGDLMFDRGVRQVWQRLGGDPAIMFENVPWLGAADVVFGNLEGPVSDQGMNVGSIYSFRMDPAVFSALRRAGFDILSFSNNHVGDWGQEAFQDTLGRAAEAGIVLAGAGRDYLEASSPRTINIKGQRLGFLAFSDVGPEWLTATDSDPGIIMASDSRLSEIIKEASAEVDWLVVSFHWGEEYETEPSFRQQELAELSKANGADLIIGHHPHVIQEVEVRDNTVTAYSLGNFIFDQYFSPDTMKGLALEVVIRGDKIEAVREKIVTLNKNLQPSL